MGAAGGPGSIAVQAAAPAAVSSLLRAPMRAWNGEATGAEAA